jgi:hypothetical protein
LKSDISEKITADISLVQEIVPIKIYRFGRLLTIFDDVVGKVEVEVVEDLNVLIIASKLLYQFHCIDSFSELEAQ